MCWRSRSKTDFSDLDFLWGQNTLGGTQLFWGLKLLKIVKQCNQAYFFFSFDLMLCSLILLVIKEMSKHINLSGWGSTFRVLHRRVGIRLNSNVWGSSCTATWQGHGFLPRGTVLSQTEVRVIWWIVYPCVKVIFSRHFFCPWYWWVNVNCMFVCYFRYWTQHRGDNCGSWGGAWGTKMFRALSWSLRWGRGQILASWGAFCASSSLTGALSRKFYVNFVWGSHFYWILSDGDILTRRSQERICGPSVRWCHCHYIMMVMLLWTVGLCSWGSKVGNIPGMEGLCVLEIALGTHHWRRVAYGIWLVGCSRLPVTYGESSGNRHNADHLLWLNIQSCGLKT